MSESPPPPDPAASPAASCNRCVDPVAITHHEAPCRRITPEVFVFRCPACGGLVLDDIVGFKGHGTVFRASEADIEAYIKAPPGRPWPVIPTPGAAKT